MIKWIIVLVVIGCLLVSGCTQSTSSTPPQYNSEPTPVVEKLCPMTDFGEGILYFYCYGNGDGPAFVKSLVKYKKEYPNMVITAISEEQTGGYGVYGYYVIVEPVTRLK